MSALPLVGPIGFLALSADPAGTWAEGSIYWNYAMQSLRVYTNGSWISTG